MSDNALQRSRRAFLRARAAPPSTVARPPWAIDGRFVDACTRCGDCVDACPEGIVAAGDGGFPVVDFARGACTFCARCAEVCPEPVFDLSRASPWSRRARVDDHCLAARGVVCRSCQDACDARAIVFAHRPGAVAAPAIDAVRCTGCGACVSVCPVSAIEVA